MSFIESLTCEDTGREEIGGLIVRYEGFSGLCQSDAVARCQLPASDPRHLSSHEAVYDEVFNQWETEENEPPMDSGFSGKPNSRVTSRQTGDMSGPRPIRKRTFLKASDSKRLSA